MKVSAHERKQWQPWVEIVEKNQVEEALALVLSTESRHLVALALAVAKWHPSRSDILDKKGNVRGTGSCGLCILHTADRYMYSAHVDCTECVLRVHDKGCSCGTPTSLYWNAHHAYIDWCAEPSRANFRMLKELNDRLFLKLYTLYVQEYDKIIGGE